ncbi:MAG: Uma2 family endonuclease [Symploca sp. SIO1C2]|nr:Uma2 family endonuclease [Symploca sp. SIO1C2]NER49399.1 Uma2 family endonuclease [Symploca sp. SIO1A3]
MTHTPVKLTFEQYLQYDDGTDNCYELWDGELIPVPPESEENGWIVEWLRDEFVQSIKRRLVKILPYELQVLGNPQNRFPDLVVLREEHIKLTKKRRTITLDMPPPQLVVEVVSPYRNQKDDNYKRDYIKKREQYEKRGIPEYWIIDPQARVVIVLLLVNGSYQETEFSGNKQIVSQTFPQLGLTAAQILEAR